LRQKAFSSKAILSKELCSRTFVSDLTLGSIALDSMARRTFEVLRSPGSDFSEAQFQREAFFLFTRFEGPGRFASAHFHAAADFTDSEFKIEDDLAQASYAQPPMLTRAKRLTTTVPGRVAAPFSQVVTIGLLLAASALLLYVIRSR
jgi:hypothetical protein